MPHSNKEPVSVIIVERNGDLRLSQMKEYSPMELCKKCKYKSPSGFEMRAEWAYSGPDEDKFTVELWAREDGKAGQENKYEFPPPVDTMMFFGVCIGGKRHDCPALRHSAHPSKMGKNVQLFIWRV